MWNTWRIIRKNCGAVGRLFDKNHFERYVPHTALWRFWKRTRVTLRWMFANWPVSLVPHINSAADFRAVLQTLHAICFARNQFEILFSSLQTTACSNTLLHANSCILVCLVFTSFPKQPLYSEFYWAHFLYFAEESLVKHCTQPMTVMIRECYELKATKINSGPLSWSARHLLSHDNR